MELLAMFIATLTPAAFLAAGAAAIVGYALWGWLGAALGLVVGYAAGMWFAGRYAGLPLSPYAKGWLSLIAFLGGLTLLAIVTR